jgi:hypothetical protein
MAMSSSRPVQFISHAIIPVICSIIVGLILCGGEVFNRYSTASQFIYSPIIASVFYFLLVLGKPRDAYAGLFVLLVLQIVLAHSTTTILVLRDLFYVAEIAAAVLLYFKYFKHSVHINPFYTAITLAGLYAATYVITSQIHLAILRDASPQSTQVTVYSMATIASFYGSTIGFAVGGGITLADKLLGEMESSLTGGT